MQVEDLVAAGDVITFANTTASFLKAGKEVVAELEGVAGTEAAQYLVDPNPIQVCEVRSDYCVAGGRAGLGVGGGRA